jgi:hypothetical protein
MVAWLFGVAACGRHPGKSPVVDAVALDAPTVGLLCAGCDPATQFCYQYAVGVMPANGCADLPAACHASPTCACTIANVSDVCPITPPYCTSGKEFAGVFVGCYLP